MDFHALPRRDLQALAKRNGVRANMTNGAMADALAALPAVDGIEEYVQQPVEEATPAAVVQPTPEEEEKPEISLPPDEVVVLDDSEEEDKDLTPDEDEEKAPPRGVGRRRVAWAEPLAATAKRNRPAARKAGTAEAVADAVPARATRGRSQRTVETDTVTAEAVPEAVPARATRARSQRTVAEDEAPKTRRTSRRAAGTKASTQQEVEEKATQGDASDVEPAMAAPVSSDEGGDGAEEMEATMDAQNEEQHAPVEEQSQEEEGETEKEDAAAVAVPARATRARSQRKVLSAAEEVAPKTRRASRRTMDAQDEEQHAPVEEQDQEVEGETKKEDAAAVPVPARATRGRRQRAVSSVAEEEAPKTRRTSRRSVAKNNSTEQEDEEKATQGDVSDVEASVPAPVSEEMEVAMDAQNGPIEVQSEEDEGEAEKMDASAVEAVPARATRARRQRAVLSVAEEVMPARATRARRQKTVVPVAVEEAPKGRRTSRRAAAKKTSAEQEEEEKRTQGDVSDMEADVPAPVSSDKEQNEAVCGSEEMEAATDAQNKEEQTTLVEEPSQEGETGTVHEEEEQGQPQQDSVSDVETAVPAASSDEEGDCAEEIEASMDAEDEEQTEQAEEQSREDEGAVADGTLLVEEEPAAAEDSLVYSAVVEQTDTVCSEEILHSSEDTEMAPVQEVPEATEEVDFSSDVSEGNEDCTAEEEPPVAEDVDSSVQESPVDVEHAGEEDEECKVDEDVQHANEENEDCKVEEELPVAEDVQECEATEEIQLATEETEMVPIKEMSQAMLESVEATEEVDCTSDDENEEFEEEPTLAEFADSSVLDVQQCETTEKIQLASEDTEMVPVLESGEATEEVDMAAEEETLVATDEMPQMLEAMEEGVAEVITIDYLTQANGEGGAVKESGFTADLTDVSMEEETVVAADEMALSLAKMGECVEEEVVTVYYLSQATDDEGAVKESGFICGLTDVSADGVVAATKDENAEEVVAVDKQSEAMVTDDEVHVKESGFIGELLDVFIEEQGVVADDEMLHSSAKMEENVQEVVTVNNMWQATVTDDEGAAKESGFLDHLRHMSVDEEDVSEADEMQVCSATTEKGVEEVVTVDKLSQATVADEEWAVTESAFTGECTPVVDTPRDLSDRIASPWSVNVFEDATKSLSMDSIAVEPMVSEPADVPLCMYSSSGGKKDATEPVAVQRENEVKEGNEPEAALGKIMHSPLTVRKLRRAVAQENESDDVPLCIFISSSGGEENSAEPVLVEREKEVNEPEAALAKIAHSPLTIRKLRRAVAEEIEADDVPLCIFTSSSGDEENSAELVLVEREKEVNKPEAALAKIAHSPLTIRKLRRAVAEENEADDMPLCIFTSSSGGEENSAEPVLVELEKEVNDHEALGSLSLRKLKTEFNQIVAVAQENEVKEGEKSSQALDKLSLRKLRTKFKETLNAHKNMETKRVPLGRLDENAC